MIKNTHFTDKGNIGEEFVFQNSLPIFFNNWCYKNPLKVQDSNKELCDFLVIFNNIAIIFQIKNIKIQGFKHKETDKIKNLNQTVGAKKYLKENINTKVSYIDNGTKKEQDIDTSKIKKYYLISVLFDENKDGEIAYSNHEMVKGEYVHILNHSFFEDCFKHIDTLKDFCDYLDFKENVGISMIINGGEKNLLAFYILNERVFKLEENQDIPILDDSLFDGLKSNEVFLKKIDSEKNSYNIDSVINTIPLEFKKIADNLVFLSRFERRILADSMQEFTEKKLKRRFNALGNTSFVFINQDRNVNKEKLAQEMEMNAYVARGLKSENKKVVVISFDKNYNLNNLDFLYFELDKWTEENEEIKQRLQKDLDIFNNAQVNKIINEYEN
jgi:hypothetical protein